MAEFYIMHKGQDEFSLADKLPSIQFLEMMGGTPQLTPAYSSVQGSDGQLLQTVAYNSSTVTVSLLIKANSRAEFNLAKTALQSELYDRKPLRIRSSADPGKAMWVLANPTDIAPLANSDDSTVNFVFTVISGMKVTPFNSDDLNANQDKLSFGMNIDVDNLPAYQFNTDRFNVFNPSDIIVDPYRQHHNLAIVIKGVGQNITVTNNTNGTAFTANTTLTNGDTLVLNGVTLEKNGVAGQVDTDFGHLVLEKGNNDISVTGLSSVNITFSFPFLYF